MLRNTLQKNKVQVNEKKIEVKGDKKIEEEKVKNISKKISHKFYFGRQMSNKQNLENIKKLREITGVGFKDCQLAIDENDGDINKSIEYLRKKGIAKASKKMSRIAADGLVLVYEKNSMISVIEINSETDFVAKNKEFITFCKEISEINFKTQGDIKKLNLQL